MAIFVYSKLKATSRKISLQIPGLSRTEVIFHDSPGRGNFPIKTPGLFRKCGNADCWYKKTRATGCRRWWQKTKVLIVRLWSLSLQANQPLTLFKVRSTERWNNKVTDRYMKRQTSEHNFSSKNGKAVELESESLGVRVLIRIWSLPFEGDSDYEPVCFIWTKITFCCSLFDFCSI